LELALGVGDYICLLSGAKDQAAEEDAERCENKGEVFFKQRIVANGECHGSDQQEVLCEQMNLL